MGQLGSSENKGACQKFDNLNSILRTYIGQEKNFQKVSSDLQVWHTDIYVCIYTDTI